MRLIVLLAAIFFKGVFLLAQEHNIRIYTTSEGLSNSYIYSVFFDSHGYMWMGSFSGFCRYDGSSFSVFGIDDGLKDPSTDFIYEDHESNIWGTGQGKVYRFEHNRFVEIPVITNKRIGFISCILQLDDGKIVFSSNAGTFAFTGEKFEPWSLYGLSPEISFRGIINLPGGHLIANTPSVIYEKKGDGNWQIVFDRSQTQIREINFTKYHQGKIYFGSYDAVYELSSDKKISLVFENRGSHSELGDFFFDRNSNMWITTSADGLYLRNQKGELKHFGKEQGIIGPFGFSPAQDKWGNIWIASYQGLMKFSTSYIERVLKQGTEDFTFRNLYKDENGLFFFGGSKGLYHFKDGQLVNLPSNNEKEIRKSFKYKYAVSIAEADDSRLWICTNLGEVFIYGEKYFKQLALPLKVFHIAFTNGRVFLGSRNKLYEWKNGQCFLIDSMAEGRPIFYISGMVRDKKDRVWFCDREKLMLFSNDSVYNMTEGLKIPDGVFSELVYENGDLWASSHRFGIVRIRELNGRYKIIGTLNKTNGLMDNSVLSFAFFGKKELWYTTSTGLYRGQLDFQKDSMFVSFNRKFGESEGLRNTIWDSGPVVSDNDGNVWVAAVNGIYKISAGNIAIDTFPPVTQIEKAELISKGVGWEKYTTTFSNYHNLPVNPFLPHRLNSLRFSFKGVTLNNAADVRYKYRLDGYDKDWSNLTSNEVATYTNLPPGDYTFTVQSMNGDGKWSMPDKFDFSIIPPFWQTWWFRGAAAVLIILGLYYFIRRRELAKLKKNQLSLQIAELKLQTLQSQMNPHFIFNSLNSVQKYILERNAVEGARYLAKFSKLIRTILDNSHFNLLPLHQIVDTLEMYIELESLRLNKEFSYELIKDADDEIMNRKLPPMLLQPFVENAIWHGLMPKEGEKKLKILIQKRSSGEVPSMQDNSPGKEVLYCLIEDNGVGKKKTPMIKGHVSRGEKMIQGMTESLQQLLGVKAEIKISDLNSDEKNTGTRVEIFVPETGIETN